MPKKLNFVRRTSVKLDFFRKVELLDCVTSEKFNFAEKVELREEDCV